MDTQAKDGQSPGPDVAWSWFHVNRLLHELLDALDAQLTQARPASGRGSCSSRPAPLLPRQERRPVGNAMRAIGPGEVSNHVFAGALGAATIVRGARAPFVEPGAGFGKFDAEVRGALPVLE